MDPFADRAGAPDPQPEPSPLLNPFTRPVEVGGPDEHVPMSLKNPFADGTLKRVHEHVPMALKNPFEPPYAYSRTVAPCPTPAPSPPERSIERPFKPTTLQH